MFSVNVSFKRVCLLVALMASAGALQAAVKLPAIFSDRMVLQQADSVPVWGWAKPGEEVTVTLEKVKAVTKADAAGKWKLELNLAKMGSGPYKMQVRGENQIEIDNVVIGQVWLASGQSNMDWRLKSTENAPQEITVGAGNFVREFTVKRATAPTEQENVSGEWVIAEPNKTGNFSAVGYYFAKMLNKELKQPVGIIKSSWGATPSEAWTSSRALSIDEDLARAQTARNTEIESFLQRQADFVGQFSQWIKAYNLQDAVFAPAADFTGADVDTSGWLTVNFGEKVTGKGLPEKGVIWLRRDVTIPKNAAGKDLTYQLEQGRSYFTIYWNGERIAGPETWAPEEMTKLRGVGEITSFRIPANLVKEGQNQLAVRIYAPSEIPGRFGWRNSLRGAADFDQGMNNGWKAKAEKVFEVSVAALAAAPKAVTAPAENQNQPARLYNAMIAPLVPYRLAGVIWYQGESNAERAWQYRIAFPMLIEDWRKAWGEPELPFYFCQLANFMTKDDAPGQSAWAELREAQSYTLKLPRTGQAILIDIGEAEDIHPRNKKDVADRLALLALANDYGRSDVVAVGPTYEANMVIGNKVYLKFKDAGPGSELVAHDLPATYPLKTINNTTKPLLAPSAGSELQGFMICGPDKKWVWAQAKIGGKHSVVVWSPEVVEPVAVRYAWANNPTCNLYNKAGLPAVPFRTDDFEATTINGRY